MSSIGLEHKGIGRWLGMNYQHRGLYACVWFVLLILLLGGLFEHALLSWYALPETALPHIWIRKMLGVVHGDAWLQKQDASKFGGLAGFLGVQEWLFNGMVRGTGPSLTSLMYWPVAYVLYCVLSACSFLGMRRRWKKRWTQADRPVWTVRLAASCLTSMLLLSAMLVFFGRTRIWKIIVFEIPYARSEGRYPGRYGPRIDNDYPNALVAVLLLFVLCLVCYVLLSKVWKQQPAYVWQLHISGLLTAVSAAVCFLFLIGEAFAYPAWVDMDRSMDGYRTGWMMASTVLVWSMGCRLFLLFGQKRYEEYCRENPEYDCRGCGYNLRGTVKAEARLCPECGGTISDEQLDLIRQHQDTHATEEAGGGEIGGENEGETGGETKADTSETSRE